eukprot:INCI4811.1.p1 GENE.INCI4811.1~~INCI4811.1.p1  ORF type:complete len:586 (+),score=79.60 INCI4811.1:72-1760(+)
MPGQLLEVVCPTGCGPGSLVQIPGPNGQLFRLNVPQGVYAGQRFRCVVDSAPAPASYPSQPQQPQPQQQQFQAQGGGAPPLVGYVSSPGSGGGSAPVAQYDQPQQASRVSAIPQQQAQPQATVYVQPPQQVRAEAAKVESYPSQSQAQAQGYPSQGQVQVQAQGYPSQGQVQVQAQGYPSQGQVQAYPSQNQNQATAGQAQPQVQAQAQVQAQPQAQAQATALPQAQGQATAQPSAVGIPAAQGGAPASDMELEPLPHGPAPAEIQVKVPPQLSAPVPQVPVNVQVTNYLSPDNERVFNFIVSVPRPGAPPGAPPDECWRFSGRFSELSKMDKKFKRKGKPAFADFHLFADYKKNMANVSKRNQELTVWCQKVLSLPGDALVSENFLQAFDVPQSAVERFHEVVRNRVAEAQRVSEVEILKQRTIQQHQKHDCRWAQSFESSLAPNGALAPLVYPKAMQFKLRNKIFSFGDATISGPGELGFFKMTRTNPSQWGQMFRNCQFSITDMSNRALVILQENFVFFTYQYTIFRISTAGQPVQLARITLTFSWGSRDQCVCRVYVH